VTKRLIDVNDDLLGKLQAQLGTMTKKETVNAALGEHLRIAAIREYVQATRIHDRRMPDLVLADASALFQGGEPAVAKRLVPLLLLDKVATCAAVAHELATWDSGTSAGAIAAVHRVTLRWLPTEDADLTRASEIQAELTGQGEPALPWTRLVVAAVAGRYDATVLHYTTDFDLIAKATGQPADWIAPTGTLPAH
jgi:predicted nucleic acid-binding protein/Arc/MetJ family transcription regulator